MRARTTACAALLAAVAATCGCDSDGSDGDSAASTTGSNGTGAAGGSASSAGGSGTGGAGSGGDMGSTGGGGGVGGTGGGGGPEVEAPLCDVPDETPSMGACVTLGGKNECNPVTQEGCDLAAGAACDTNVAIDGFSCYPSENVHGLCEMCGDGQGYCQPGMACPGTLARFGGPGLCSKYCCTDADCGAAGACSKELMESFGLPTGYCVAAP